MTTADPPIVLLHGFTQTGASWAPVVAASARLQTAVRPDLPGHGAADPARDDSTLAETAAALAAAVDGPARWVGYSMGGRVALRLALDHPEVVSGLVLIGATAGIDDPVDRAERRRADDALATRIETEGVDRFLDGWLAQPLFADLSPTPADLVARRANRAEGLAASLRAAGTGTMDPPWWDDLASITAPVTIVVGERDAKFRVLGARLAAGIGGPTQTVVIEGAGHAAHLERPAEVAAVIATAPPATPERRRPTTLGDPSTS